MRPLFDQGATLLAERSADRALALRHAAYTDEALRLMSAAHRVMERSGDFDPRVSEILKEADLSNQAFYRHFASKEALLMAVVEAGTQRLRSYLLSRMAGKTSVAQIREWVRGFARQALNDKVAAATRPFVIPRARLLERFPESIRAAERELIAPLAEAIAMAQRERALQANLDTQAAAVFVYDLVKEWLQRQLIERGAVTQDHQTKSAAALEDFVMAGLGVAPQ